MSDNITVSRRTLLRTLGAGVVSGIAGCNTGGNDSSATTTNSPTGTGPPTETHSKPKKETTTREEWTVDPVEHDKLIGAIYKVNFRGEEGYVNLDHPWLKYTSLTPVLGQYRSRDPHVINQHVKWARGHGINWFNVKVGAPDGFEERTFRDHVLEAELADEVYWSILDAAPNAYLEGGRIDLDRDAVRQALAQRLQHWSEVYFHRDTYLHIDGRPVLYYYNLDLWNGNIADAISEVTASIPEDPYLIGDVYISRSPGVLMPTPAPSELAPAFDALYDYHVHPVLPRENFLDHVNAQYEEWCVAAKNYDLDFIPTVIPGFKDDVRANVDDPGLPESHPGLADNQNLPRNGERFRQMCRDALHYLDQDIDAVMVNTFNEWQESTTVEPGETYGTDYLEIVQEELARGQSDYLPVEDYVPIEFGFNRTEEVSGDGETAIDFHFAFQAATLTVDDSNNSSQTYDIGAPLEEPVFTEGVYPPTNSEGTSRESRRWFGGPTGRTTIYFDHGPPDADAITLTGRPIADDISAKVRYDDTEIGELVFDDGMSEYRVQVP